MAKLQLLDPDTGAVIMKSELLGATSEILGRLKGISLDIDVSDVLPSFQASEDGNKFGMFEFGWATSCIDNFWASVPDERVPAWIKRSEEDTRAFLAI
jgi:hypothetical protein